MPSARSIRAGAAYVELYVQDNRLVRGLNKASRRLRDFSAGVSDIGKRMMSLSAVMASPFVVGVKVFADFEQQMATVSTMLKNPQKDMERFKDSIREMSVEFGESTDTLSKGLYDILSASVPAEKALDVLAASAKAAKAGLTDTGTAADAITTVLNAYGLSAEHAGDISDWMFQVVARGKTTFGQLAPSIGQVASIASSAGLSLDEMGAALATMTRNGVQTDSAITALTAIVSSFLKPTAEAADYAEELGFNMNAATLRAEGLEGVFNRISKLPPDAIARLFPNVRALRGVLPALQNMEGFAGDLIVMGKRAGATEDAYKKMTNTLSHRFNQLKQTAVQIFSVIGEAIAEPIGKATEHMKQFGDAVITFIQNNRQLIVTAAKIVLVIGAVGAALVALGASGAALGVIFGGLATIVGGVGTVLGILGSILASLLTPMGMVVGGLVALATYFIYVSDAGTKALEWLGKKFSDLKDHALTAFGAISDALAAGDIGLAATVLWLTLKMEFTKGVNVLKGFWLDFKGFFLEVWNAAIYGTLSVATKVWAELRRIWNDVVSGLTRGLNMFIAAFRTAWTQLNAWAEELFTRFFMWLDGTTGEAADATIREIRRRADEANVQIIQEFEATDQQVVSDQKRRQAEIDRNASTDLNAIQDAWNAAAQQNKQAFESERKQNQAALDAARQEWEQAVTQAREARRQAEAPAEGRPEQAKMPEVADARSAVEDMMNTLTNLGDSVRQQAEAAIGVQGTFNATAARGLESGGTAERTARASEETAKNTRRLVNEARDGGLVFA